MREYCRLYKLSTCGVHLKMMAILIVFSILSISNTLYAHEKTFTTEDKARAAIIYKFIKHIKWPEASFINTQKNFLICTDETAEFKSFIEQLHQADPNALAQYNVRTSSEIASPYCHITYLSMQTFNIIPASTSRLLVVSEHASKHPLAAITITQEANNIKYEINLKKINNLKLVIDQELLKHARITNS